MDEQDASPCTDAAGTIGASLSVNREEDYYLASDSLGACHGIGPSAREAMEDWALLADEVLADLDAEPSLSPHMAQRRDALRWFREAVGPDEPTPEPED